MNRCKTCLHWGEPDSENPPYRKCTHETVDSGSDDGCAVTEGEPYNSGTFSTGPRFGCIHHELKD